MHCAYNARNQWTQIFCNNKLQWWPQRNELQYVNNFEMSTSILVELVFLVFRNVCMCYPTWPLVGQCWGFLLHKHRKHLHKRNSVVSVQLLHFLALRNVLLVYHVKHNTLPQHTYIKMMLNWLWDEWNLIQKYVWLIVNVYWTHTHISWRLDRSEIQKYDSQLLKGQNDSQSFAASMIHGSLLKFSTLKGDPLPSSSHSQYSHCIVFFSCRFNMFPEGESSTGYYVLFFFGGWRHPSPWILTLCLLFPQCLNFTWWSVI